MIVPNNLTLLIQQIFPSLNQDQYSTRKRRNKEEQVRVASKHEPFRWFSLSAIQSRKGWGFDRALPVY